MIKYFNEKFGMLKNHLGLQGNSNGSTNFTCYKQAVKKFESACGNLNAYAYKYLRYLNEMCQHTSGFGMEHINSTIDYVCSQ